MSKIVSGLFLCVAFTGSALAGPIAAVPAPEVTGGILGMFAAAGVVYLMKRRANRS
jgi:hypothetical protein